MNNPNIVKQQDLNHRRIESASAGSNSSGLMTDNVFNNAPEVRVQNAIGLNRSLSNILNKSVDQTVLQKIRDFDPDHNSQTPTILPQSTNNITPGLKRSAIFAKSNPLHANTGLYFRDILKTPDESVSISQSIRTRGTRFGGDNNLQR